MNKLAVLLLFLAIAFVAAFFWWNNGVSAVDKKDASGQMFVIEKGAGLRAIANNLKEQDLIKDPVVFFLLVKQLGLDTKIQAGDFRLSPSQNAQEIAEALTKGSLDVWVTIPEGKRADEIADILESRIPSYDASWRMELVANEGYLFPDTYLIPKDASIDLVLQIFRNNFTVKYQTVPNTAGKSQEKIVILASLIEREARHDADRPIIASVIQNRLDDGMKLDIDATVQYVVGYQPTEKSWWKRHLTLADLRINSPYNTYTNAGLPPTPIANPGVESLQAAANPANTSYYYYLSDKNGINRYARTLEEHNTNIERYGL